MSLALAHTIQLLHKWRLSLSHPPPSYQPTPTSLCSAASPFHPQTSLLSPSLGTGMGFSWYSLRIHVSRSFLLELWQCMMLIIATLETTCVMSVRVTRLTRQWWLLQLDVSIVTSSLLHIIMFPWHHLHNITQYIHVDHYRNSREKKICTYVYHNVQSYNYMLILCTVAPF